MKSLADPTKLNPVVKKEGLVQVIIETPAGSRNKFAFDPDQGKGQEVAFRLIREAHKAA
jgi:inorganic pyrophosphatase